uniref:Fatty acid synthase n=1 Tax=Lygus hesperus TaxID=30085 RepID=A0A146M080_LYGHE
MEPINNIFFDREGSIEAGRKLCSVAEGDEIVVSGIAGVFPDSDNVVHFSEQLMNKVDLITEDDRRWTIDHPEIPNRTGKINNVEKFDAAFFGLHYNQAQCIDPMTRIFMEKAFECVVDAGFSPLELRGSKTAVIVGACFSESEKTWFFEKLQANGFGVTGVSRSMMANRVSYYLGLDGPSYTVDSACSSSMYALEQGYKAIQLGHCDSAIIGGCNLCLHPYVSLQFARLGVLSRDGRCKVFDEKANGYCRSEAICAMFLQKKKNSRRVYARVMHVKTNCDGFKDQGITYPSGEIQQCLLQEFYEECDVDPTSLAWIEAHGTGTRVGDPEEIKALVTTFCAGRKEPLKIGSLKSNIGHSEPASGLCSITKVIIAMETGLIPPNINFETPRKDIPYLTDGTMTVVTEPTPWEGGLVGVNSFGFGGANCHALFDWNPKNKVDGGRPLDDLPRLINVSARTEKATRKLLDFIENRPLDAEFVSLLHEVYKKEIPAYLWRGFAIMDKEKGCVSEKIQNSGLKRPHVVLFPGNYSELCRTLDSSLLKLPVVAESVETLGSVLKMDLKDLLFSVKPNKPDSLINNFVATVAIQIILVDLMKSLDLEIESYAGVSVGEISCAYADGCLTAEEAISIAYYTAVALVESDLPSSLSVKIDMSASQLKSKLVGGVELHPIGTRCSYIIGSKSAVEKIVEPLKKDGIEVENIKAYGYPIHSKTAGKVASKALNYISKVLKGDKRNTTKKWINGHSFVDAEYFSQLATTSVPYEVLWKLLDTDSVVLSEVGPTGKHVLTSVLDSVCVPGCKGVPNLLSVFEALGKLYLRGIEMNLTKLYPKIQYPVARTTPMIAPLIGWDHSKDWYVGTYKLQGKLKSGEKAFTINLKEEEYEFLSGHIIDGRNLYPATGYLALVWETLGLMEGQLFTEMDIVFEDVRFLRATNISKDGSVELVVSIQKTGSFEVTEGGAAIVTGKAYVPQDVTKEMTSVKFESSGEYPMSSKDIYKELRLRGYNYKGLFRSLVGANPAENTGKIHWYANWVAFMDNMLQTQLVYDDLRGLFVPTSIDCLVIDTKGHHQYIQEFEDRELPVFVDKNAHVIKCGGVEIRGMKVNAIARKKFLAEPVLEDYRFVPNATDKQTFTLAETVRVAVQTIMENDPNLQKVKVVELEPTEGKPILSTLIALSISDLPLTQPDVTILCNPSHPAVEGVPSEIVVEEKALTADMAANIVAGRNIFSEANKEKVNSVVAAIKKGGFLLTVEDPGSAIEHSQLNIIQDHVIEEGRIILLRKTDTLDNIKYHTIKFTRDASHWLTDAQEALKNSQYKRILFVAQDDPLSGLLGFTNCLMREPDCGHVRCVLIMDKDAPKFSLDDPLYKTQLAKDLNINVFKDGQWGTYRHTLLDGNKKVMSSHIHMNYLTRGDLSSLTWVESRLSKPRLLQKVIDDKKLIHVEFASLNFRDVMLATAKLAPESVVTNRKDLENCTGFEFSGSLNGERVMILSGREGFTNLFMHDHTRQSFWKIPESWTYEQAATVPVVYATVLYAVYICGRMKKGESILIHSGSGGVGQAAIRIAQYEGLEVFTTVGTPEKKEFLLKNFPGLKESHIGNSRDCSFEQMIMRETNGRGVDMVLNSLAEEKLLASVRCLARGGRFLEIGKYDITNNNPLGMELFKRGASFQGIMVDNLMKETGNKNLRVRLDTLMQQKIDEGAVVPLPATVFEQDQQEQAFRFMASGKHIGKVMIKINQNPDETSSPLDHKYLVKPKFYCDPEFTYVVAGGLGGFGLELVDWLVLRGAMKVLINSRRGLTNGYQSFRLKWLRELYKADVRISTVDITTPEGAKKLITEATEMGPVAGIFNLAVVLRDSLFLNLTLEQFEESLGPKANATLYLDQVSRVMCPQLEHFVVFSSVSCGLGNIGQTNYGMSNSVMERICEDRKRAGFPGLAVQWGAVGDVGLVADMQEEHVDVVIGGTLQQRISNCLELMDVFLRQDAPIVSSMVVAEKKFGAGAADNIVDTVLEIIGLRDLKTVSLHSTLAELGMDSMMAVEIKQTLEREFEIFLSPQDIRGLTFAKLQEMSSKDKDAPVATEKEPDVEVEVHETLFAVIQAEPEKYLPCVSLPTLVDEVPSESRTITFALPGIEGFASVFETLAMKLYTELHCLQLDYTQDLSTVGAITDSLLPYVKAKMNPESTFNLIGYSFGGLVALEMVHRLEKEGYSGQLILIDSSPATMRKLALHTEDEDRCDARIIIDSISYLTTQVDWKEVEEELVTLKDRQARAEFVTKMLKGLAPASDYFIIRMLLSLLYRSDAAKEYPGVPLNSIRSPVTLVKPTQGLSSDTDYQLDQYLKSPAEMHVVEGNHLSVLSTPKTASIVNEVIQKNPTVLSKSHSFTPSQVPDPLHKDIK